MAGSIPLELAQLPLLELLDLSINPNLIGNPGRLVGRSAVSAYLGNLCTLKASTSYA
ncbi:unnamed protein product, partial [Phaeothamnion confervicola]